MDELVELSGWTELSDTFTFHNLLKANELLRLNLTLEFVLALIRPFLMLPLIPVAIGEHMFMLGMPLVVLRGLGKDLQKNIFNRK